MGISIDAATVARVTMGHTAGTGNPIVGTTEATSNDWLAGVCADKAPVMQQRNGTTQMDNKGSAFRITPSLTERERMSETDDRQKARTVCTIGTQPVIPAVYGVKAPL